MLPDPHDRVKRVASRFFLNPTRLTRTRLLLEFTAGKDRRRGTAVFCRLQGPGIVCPVQPFVNYRASSAQNSMRHRTIPAREDCFWLPRGTSTLFPAPAQVAVQIRVIVVFPKIPYRSGTSQNDVRVGPIPRFPVTPEKGVRSGPRGATSPLSNPQAVHRDNSTAEPGRTRSSGFLPPRTEPSRA